VPEGGKKHAKELITLNLVGKEEPGREAIKTLCTQRNEGMTN